MKRFLAFALVLLLMLSFTACGEDKDKIATAHSINVRDAFCERLGSSSLNSNFVKRIQDISCSKTMSGINCSVTKSIAFGYDIAAVVEITPGKNQLKRDYPNGLTVSEIEVLSNDKPVSSDLTVVSDLIFSEDQNINAVFIHISSDSPDFSIGDTITLNIKGISPIGSDDSIEIKKPFELSWTVTKIISPISKNLKNDKFCGSVAITPLSLHLEFTESPYDSAEKLFQKVEISPYYRYSFFVSENLDDPDFKFVVSDSDGVQRCSAIFPQGNYKFTDDKNLLCIGEAEFLL